MSASATPERTETAPRVIVVEDNAEAANLLREWLKPRFPVTAYADAEAALRQLGPNPSDDEMVFLIDYNMPGDNGITLKKKLTPLFPKAKYILVSGLFDSKLTAEAREAGFDALLPKPFGMPALTQKIEALLGLAPKESLVDLVKRQTGRLPMLAF